MLLTSTLIALCSENTCVILKLCNLFKLDLRPRTLLIFVYDLCAFKKVYPAVDDALTV